MDAMHPLLPPRDEAHGPPRRVSRPLWAAPLFLAGVGVLALVCVTRPLFNRPARLAARDLAAARQLLEQPDTLGSDAEALVRRVLARPEFVADRIGEATFL